MRRLAVLALAAVTAAALAGTASAYRGIPYTSAPINSPANREAVRAIVANIDSGTAASPSAQTGIARAQTAASRLAPLRTLGTIALGSYTVYKIADSLGVGGYIYKKITGEPPPGTPVGWTASWNSICTSGCFTNAVSGYTGPGWFLRNSSFGNLYCATPGGACNINASWQVAASGIAGTGFATTATTCGLASGSCLLKVRSEAQLIPSGGVTVQSSNATEYAAAPAGQKQQIGSNDTSPITDVELDAALDAIGARDSVDRRTTDPSAEAAVDWINAQLDPTYSPDDAPTPNCLGLSTSACGALFTAAGFAFVPSYTAASFAGADVTRPAETVVAQPVAAGVAKPLGFTWPAFTTNPAAEDMPFAIPRPRPNETYDDWAARMTEDGYLGSITTVELGEATADTSVGPRGVSRITTKLNASATSSTLAVPAWPPPTSPVRIRTAEPVVAAINPPTMPPVDSDGDGEPDGDWAAGPPADGECPCPIHSLDFSPLTSIDYGDKFPFGVFPWLLDQLAYLDPEPEGPHIHVTIPSLQAGPFQTGAMNYGWDFRDPEGHVFDEYIATVRTALTWLLWLGGLFYLAGRLLNLRGAPDTRIDGDDG
jgi:hypothetical protein